MITDIAIVILAALLLNYLFTKLGLPGLLGMIAAGILLGPEVLNFIDEPTQKLFKEFKTVALIVILIRAGLGINKKTLNKIGGPAIRMSFIPGILEGITIMFIACVFLNFSIVEGGMLGFIIAAVSPAVVVPQMLDLKEKGYGKKKEVPTLVLAGASLDDVFAITIFGVFTGIATGAELNIGKMFLTVPAGIVTGACLGIVLGFALLWFFKKVRLRDTKKVLIFLILAVLFYEFTELPDVKQIIPIAGLLGVMAIGFVILEKNEKTAHKLAAKFGKVWVLAEILLFVYIGSEVRLSKIDSAFIFEGLAIIGIGLIARSIGVWFSLLGSKLNKKEKLFCTMAYWPKATVQAAISAVPLMMFYEGKTNTMTEQTGIIILSIAVLSIITTAPLGAICIKIGGKRLLSK